MRAETRKFLHDTIADLLDLPGKSVIWNRQNGYKQNPPLVTLMAYSEQGEAMADMLPTENAGEYDLKTPTQFVLEVQYFGNKGTFPMDILSDLVRQWDRPTILDLTQNAGVALLFADPVQDLTGLEGNEQVYEPRAAVDLHFRYTAVVTDDPGYIDEVDAVVETIDPETGETIVNVTGKLIPGNLIRGEEPDLTGAIDVDFTASAKDK